MQLDHPLVLFSGGLGMAYVTTYIRISPQDVHNPHALNMAKLYSSDVDWMPEHFTN